MPDFAYIARDRKGQKVTGTITAGSQREAAAAVSGKALFPIEVTEEKAAQSLLGRRVGGQLMAVTYSQMSSLLRSGVPLLRSIRVLRDQASNQRLQTVLAEIHDRVEQGDSLGEALARHPKIFSEMAINMVKAGGEGGFLEDALERVASFTEEQEDLKSRTVGALAYPAFLAVAGSAVVTILVVFFVPKFAEIFDRLRKIGELPMMTEILLAISDFIRGYWWVIAIVVVGGFLFSRFHLNTPQGRRMKDTWKLRIPLFGNVFLNLAVARFCRVLGTLLKNGVPIVRSLDISRDAAGNVVLADAIDSAKESISSGEPLASPLAASGKFPQTVVEMISVAEEANTLDNVLIEISDGLERRTSRRLDLIVRLLEPMMLLVLAGVVLCVVIALLLPVIKMSSTI